MSTAIDAYDEDDTELQFLKSKPTCFIVLGKPGCGKSSIAKRLSQIWRCQLLNPTEMIKKEIENSTEIGKEMNGKLMRGEALSTEYIVQFIRDKIKSPEVAHYGYVLEGLPTLDHSNMSITQQLNMIKQWNLNPDFIINIKILDEDLKIRRLGIRSDPISGKDYISRTWKDVKERKLEDYDEDDLIEDGEEEEEEQKTTFIDPFALDFPALDSATRERLVRIPEYFPSTSNKQVDQFQSTCIPVIDNFIANHKKLNVIELDGNEAPTTLFRQLISKLDSYPLRRAVVPQRLMQGNGEEEEDNEMGEGMETDELLRTVAGYQMPAPSHRWRRSKWSRYCPVALRDGQILHGKAEFSVSFLDKIFVMSSAEAMTNFMKNPRPFLLPPFPQIPCKLAVLGHPHSGKSCLAQQLARHYDAEVIDMDILMKATEAELREEITKKAYEEAIPAAIQLVQKKLQDEANEKKQQEEAIEKKLQEEEEYEKKLQEEEGGNEKKLQEEEGNEKKSEAVAIDQQSNDEDGNDPGDNSAPIDEVTEDDARVKEIAEKAGKVAADSMVIPVAEYMKILQGKLEEISRKRLKRNPDAATHGGWVLDNFPQTKEQFTAMQELSLLPDQLFVLHDRSPTHDHIRQKFYELNKLDIDTSYRERSLQEKRKEIEQEKENLIQGSLPPSAENGETPEGQLPTTEGESELHVPAVVVSPSSEKLTKLEKELEELKNEVRGEILPPADILEFALLHKSIAGNNNRWTEMRAEEVISVKIADISTEKEIFHDCVQTMKEMFEFSAWEFTPQDIEEEEEDVAAMDELIIEDDDDDDEDEEEGDEEDEEKARRRKRKFGSSKHWDIVELHEKLVLCPGDADFGAKFRDRTYIFSSDENRSKFVANPHEYIATKQPLQSPPLRLLMLGPRASGKTLHGRWLAEKLGIFHISFRDRLQEMIMSKTGRKMGLEFEEDKLLTDEMKISVDEAVERAKHSFYTPLNMNEGEEESSPLGGEEGEEDDEERFDFSPDEEAIRNYLVDDEPLTTEVLDQIIPQFWKEKPYKENGFILEGFPRNSDECQYLQQRGFYPDLAVALSIEEDDVTKRMLKTKLNKWKRRKAHHKEKRDKIMEAKKQHRQEWVERRRKVLVAEKLKEKAADETDEEGDDEDEEDIENQLNDEFPEDEDEEDDDTEEETDAIERMKGEYFEQFESDTTNLDSVYEQLAEIKIEKIEISASRKPSIVRYYLDNKLKNVIENRRSLFEKPYPVNMEHASKMINTGYKHPSAFAYWDPVELANGAEVAAPPLRDAAHPSYPVVHNQFIYFLSTPLNRAAFVMDPLSYTQDKFAGLKPVVPIQLAIVGPPKSGKTEVSARFAEKYGLVHVSIGRAIRRTLTVQAHTLLAQEINKYLYQGKIVPLQLAMQSVANMLLDTTTTSKGYVLDGCPVDKKQAEMLRKFGIIPLQVMNLQTTAEETLKRAVEDRKNRNREEPLHDSGKIMAMRYKVISDELVEMEKFYTNEHQNWLNIETNLSKWKTWNLMDEENMKSLRLVQDYVHRSNKGEAGRLASLCISPSEFHKRISPSYRHYCSVELNDHHNLVDCSNDNLQFAVEFDSKYYKCASMMNLRKFIATPKRYAEGEKLPSKLPRKISAEELKRKFPMKLELGGYCPVSYVDGKLRYEALKEGNDQFAAEFDGRLFIFQNEEKLMKFMKKPTKYTDIKLPKKLPPKKLKINTVELPVLGYLEQECTDLVIKSLNQVGCLKPKLPFLSVKKSAVFYMACYLKAHNEKSSQFSRQIFQDKLKKMEGECDLISYLATNMTSVFKHHRSQEFEDKMKIFLAFDQPCLSRPLQI